MLSTGMSQCLETSGFLFSHPCNQAATGACQKCGKHVCARHTHPTPSGFMCTSCAKKEVQRTRQQRQAWSGWDDDPYLYDTYYYSGYGYYGRGSWGWDLYGNDFTEADGDSFQDGTDGDWEHDMGGS